MSNEIYDEAVQGIVQAVRSCARTCVTGGLSKKKADEVIAMVETAADNNYFAYPLSNYAAKLDLARQQAAATGSTRPAAVLVFIRLIEVMNFDNGASFAIHASDVARALPAIESLMSSGFFLDDYRKTESSFYQMAAGESELRMEFFAAADRDALDTLDALLNEIFDRPAPFSKAPEA